MRQYCCVRCAVKRWCRGRLTYKSSIASQPMIIVTVWWRRSAICSARWKFTLFTTWRPSGPADWLLPPPPRNPPPPASIPPAGDLFSGTPSQTALLTDNLPPVVPNYLPKTKHLYNIYTMLDQRLRRWADVAYMLYKCFVFAGYLLVSDVVNA